MTTETKVSPEDYTDIFQIFSLNMLTCIALENENMTKWNPVKFNASLNSDIVTNITVIH